MTLADTERRTLTADLASLAAELSGDLVLPDSHAYEDARSVWNLLYQARPAAIVRAATVGDVAAAVRFAREADLELAVRSGGHSLSGDSSGDGVLVIDTRAMREFHVDPASRIVSAGPGLTAGHVSERLAAHGLAIPFGDTGSVGIAGLTLGGGIGYLARRHGLAIDRVRHIEMVTASGDVVEASANENSDLFWALRGGGGNFGIVTRFTYEAVPVGDTLAGALVLPLTTDVLRGVIAIADAAPDELTTITEVMSAAPPAPFIPPELVGTPVVFVLLVYAGEPAAGQPIVDEFRGLGNPIADLVAPMPYPGIYDFSVEAETPAPALTRSFFTGDLDDTAIDRIVERMSEPSRPGMAVTQLRVLGGEMGRVPADASAFAHRDAKVMFSIYTLLLDAERRDHDTRWTDAYFGEMRPKAHGVYVNFLDRDEAERIHEAYPAATFRRLTEIKARWDPDNLFRRNRNVRPAS